MRAYLLLMLAAVTSSLCSGTEDRPASKKDYPIQAVPFTDVRVNDPFWGPRLETNRTVTIPHLFRQCELTGRIDNFRFAAGISKGKFTGFHFNDSDVYKSIEAAAYSLAVHPDEALERYLDTLITLIGKAQEKDGYLYTPRELMTDSFTPPGGRERWNEAAGSHELYCAGHMYEAAVAHFLATGKRTFLAIALRNADLIASTFGPEGRRDVPGHQEIEIGLCKLYRVTGNERYLRTAKFFLDERGHANGRELQGEYSQDHKPVAEQTEAVGHAVRAMYMFSGMADVAALAGVPAYITALDALWQDVVGKKIYLTGGIGASGNNEGFNGVYELPNQSAYCETCASIANAYWNYRMFLLHGNGRYMDVLERTLYNALLSGVAMTGDRFFYPNPLEAYHGRQRSAWFDCACCPPNVSRFLASLPGYVYAQNGDLLYVNLFMGGKATVPMQAGPVTITQETRYPWDGAVRITVLPRTPRKFALLVRIPGWSQGKAIAGDLYTYASMPGQPETKPAIMLRVNRRDLPLEMENGYAVVRRLWSAGDVLELSLPMPVQRVTASEHVKADRGRVAVERGPVVFCLEGPDNGEGRVVSMVIPDTATFTTKFRPDLLNGVQTVSGSGIVVRRTLDRKIVLDPAVHCTAIPYYAWAHRDPSQMTVWPAREPSVAVPVPAPTVASTSTVTASAGKSAVTLNDQLLPSSSNDPSVPFMHWWPRKGSQEWVQYDFAAPAKVSSVSVYWFDDTGVGECRVPASWRVLYRDGDHWSPLPGVAAYSLEKDRANTVSCTPVETTGLRLELDLQKDFSAGIYEWSVNE